MKYRQREALKHPIGFYQGEPKMPHPKRVDKLGQRVTILTVNEFQKGVWVWQASVSFGREPLGMWSPERTEKAHQILLKLLNGIGDKNVFMVGPQHVELWKTYPDMEEWDVLNDPDATARIHADLGFDLPVPPGQFAAMHIWKSLTDEEVEQLGEPV